MMERAALYDGKGLTISIRLIDTHLNPVPQYLTRTKSCCINNKIVNTDHVIARIYFYLASKFSAKTG